MDRGKQLKQLERMFEFGVVSKAILTERIEIIEEQFPDCDTEEYRERLRSYKKLDDNNIRFQYVQ